MDKFTELLNEYLVKSIDLTEKMIECDYTETEKVALMTENRERLMYIIEKIASFIEWENIDDSTKEDINKKINYINKLDEKLLVNLQQYKQETQEEIKQNFQTKENIKGYNLNDLK